MDTLLSHLPFHFWIHASASAAGIISGTIPGHLHIARNNFPLAYKIPIKTNFVV
jgi:hypothetical protein